MASKDFQVLNHMSNLKLFQAPSDTWLGTSQKKKNLKFWRKTWRDDMQHTDNVSETQSHVVSVEWKTLMIKVKTVVWFF